MSVIKSISSCIHLTKDMLMKLFTCLNFTEEDFENQEDECDSH